MAGSGASQPSIEALLGRTEWARALARRLVGERDADDLVQEAWLSILRGAAGRDGASGPTESFWRTILSRRAVDLHRSEARRARREERAATPTEAPAADEAIEGFELHRLLVEAVDRLAEPYRSVVILRFFEELSVREIARRRGAPVPTVRSWIARGLSRLREDLDRSFRGRRLAGILGLCAFGRSGAEGAAGGGAAIPGIPRSTVALLSGPAAIAAAVAIAVAAAVWGSSGVRSDANPGPLPRAAEEARAPPAPAPGTPGALGSESAPAAGGVGGGSEASAAVAILRGRLRTSDAGSLAGERVGLLGSEDSGCEIGDDGSFEIVSDHPISSGLWLRRGTTQVQLSERFRVELGETGTVDVALEPGASCEIHCRDADTGAPVAAAQIRLDGAGKDQSATVFGESDRRGELAPPLVLARSYRLEVMADGYQVHQGEVSVPTAEPHLVRLRRAAVLRVTIEGLERYPEMREAAFEFRPRGGLGLAGLAPGLRSSYIDRVVLGPSNRAELEAPPSGTYELILLGNGVRPPASTELVVPDGVEAVEVTLRIPREDGFLGRAVDAMGAPLYPGYAGFRGVAPGPPTILDAEGRFRHPQITADIVEPCFGDHTEERRIDYILGPVRVLPPSPQEVTLRVGGRTTLAVEVTGVPAGRGERELSVQVQPESMRGGRTRRAAPPAEPPALAGTLDFPVVTANARTDRSSVRIPRLAAGRALLRVELGGVSLLTTWIELAEGENAIEVPYVEPAVLEIVPIPREGESPPMRIHITREGEDGIPLWFAHGDVIDGRCRIEVPGQGPVELRFSGEGFETIRRNIDARPGSTVEVSLELVPRRLPPSLRPPGE